MVVRVLKGPTGTATKVVHGPQGSRVDTFLTPNAKPDFNPNDPANDGPFRVKITTPDASFDSAALTKAVGTLVAPKTDGLPEATLAQVNAMGEELKLILPDSFANTRQWLLAPHEEPPNVEALLGAELKKLTTNPMIVTALNSGTVDPSFKVEAALHALGFAGRMTIGKDVASLGPEILEFASEAFPLLLGQLRTLDSVGVPENGRMLRAHDFLPKVSAQSLAAMMGFRLKPSHAKKLQTVVNTSTPSTYKQGVKAFFERRIKRPIGLDDSFSAFALAMSRDLNEGLSQLRLARNRLAPRARGGWLGHWLE